MIVARYLFGLSGSALTQSALGAGAQRTNPSEMLAYLNAVRPLLDIDGDGRVDALTDGLMILRYAFGLRGSALVTGAVAPGATRASAALIESYIGGLFR